MPSVVPGAVPGVTIAPAPGEVPVPPDLAGAPAVTPRRTANRVSGDAAYRHGSSSGSAGVPAPPLSASAAGKTVVSVAQRQNEKVQEVADTQTQNLQAAGAPETAKAIQQVAQQAKTEASVTAAEFLDQALAQQAVDNVTGVPPVAPVEAPGAVQPGEFVQPGYTASCSCSAGPHSACGHASSRSRSCRTCCDSTGCRSTGSDSCGGRGRSGLYWRHARAGCV